MEKTTDSKGYLDMELLRFTTAGSVDDGKSTLIGRLLYDSKSIFEDQLEAVEAASRRRGNGEVDLALLTDGLRSEREQGITIDVAYRYFATPKRKFIIADTPGHIQYTRNMITGASTAELAIILIDARNGVMEQTVRHSYIASLLGIRSIVVCINKMDLVDFSQSVFDDIREKYMAMAKSLRISDARFIPISAKFGDNVVERSANMPWYSGPTLMEWLENVPVQAQYGSDALRFPVQYVLRPMSDKFHDYRGYAGRVASGTLKKGAAVVALPSGMSSKVAGINLGDRELDSAVTSESVAVQLVDDIDLSRGDILVEEGGRQPDISQGIKLMICWFNQKPLRVGDRYIIRHMARETQGIATAINFRIDINTLREEGGVDALVMNDIASINLKTAVPLVFDPYTENRTTGSLIFIDLNTWETMGAGMIVSNL